MPRKVTKTVYKRKYTKKPAYTKKQFAKTLRSLEPAKHMGGEVSVSTTVAGSFYSWSPTQVIAPGTGDSNRIGNSIMLEALKLNGYMFSPAVALVNTKWRVSVYLGTQQFNLSAGTISTSGPQAADLFIPNTFAVNPIGGVMNPKTVRLLYDTTIDLNSIVSTSSDIRSFAVTVPIHKKYEYRDVPSYYGKTTQLYVTMQAYNAGGASSANCGAFYCAYDLIFKGI